MIDFTPLFEFSRSHCVAICAFLVPANLLATSQTLILISLHRSEAQIRLAFGIAISCALVMIFHVGTWFAIGVVMAPTFILLGLGTTCLGINCWAIAYPQTFRRLLGVLRADKLASNLSSHSRP